MNFLQRLEDAFKAFMLHIENKAATIEDEASAEAHRLSATLHEAEHKAIEDLTARLKTAEDKLASIESAKPAA